MANQTLRELAKEHAQGDLDKESYRKSRAKLIQGITVGTIPVIDIDYPPLVQPPEPESLDDTQRKDDYKKTPAKNANSEAKDSSRPAVDKPAGNADAQSATNSNKMLFIGLAVVIVIIISVVFVFVGGESKQSRSATASNTESAESTITAPTTRTRAQELIQDFLNKKNWSSSTLDMFLQQWAELPAADILTSKNSLEMGQLTNAIFKQLLEEQALSGLVDDDSSLLKQQQLVQFAAELGIDDARIALPEETQVMENIEP